MKRLNPEQMLQQNVTQFLDLALPSTAYWSAIGHGGGGKVRGAILKSMGVKPGVPDIFVVYSGSVIFIELKAKKGRTSEAQDDSHLRIIAAGASVFVCRAIEEVARALTSRGVPLRANIA